MKSKRIKNLPNWCVTNQFPSAYDTDSATAIEMVAKLYAAMQETIDFLNEYVDENDEIVLKLKEFITKDQEAFKMAIEQKFADFVEVQNTKYDYLELLVEEIDKLIKDLNEGRGE